MGAFGASKNGTEIPYRTTTRLPPCLGEQLHTTVRGLASTSFCSYGWESQLVVVSCFVFMSVVGGGDDCILCFR